MFTGIGGRDFGVVKPGAHDPERPSQALVRIGEMLVDLPALLRLHHEYNPAACSAANCCCGSYEVTVAKRELRRIAGMIPESSRFARGLRDADGTYENPFEPVEPGLYALDTDEHGRCVFAYRDRQGVVRCSIHSAALKLGLEPYTTKPFVCTLWPLALTDDHPPVLTVQEDAYRFPCNRQLRVPGHALTPEVALIMDRLFGPEFLQALNAAIPPR